MDMPVVFELLDQDGEGETLGCLRLALVVSASVLLPIWQWTTLSASCARLQSVAWD